MGLFTSKKKKLLETGILANAVIKQVRDTGVTINMDPQVKLILEVQPHGGEPFEASVNKLVSRLNIPRPGAEVFVRYDPADRSKVVIDERAVSDYNAKAEVKNEEAAALAAPPELLANGIPGRAIIKSVTTRGRAGDLVKCDVNASIRLIDGTPPFEVTFQAALAPDTVQTIQGGGPIIPFPARVDPANRSHVALSLTEGVPVVPWDNPTALAGPEAAKQSGVPRTITVLEIQRQFLRLSTGEEIYSMRARLDNNKEVLVGTVLVPAGDEWLLKVGKTLPARVLASDESVLAVDWETARRGAGALAG